jgi:uncharacterized protein YjbI with pentapeptide repeats
MSQADLGQAMLVDANLSGANLTNTKLQGVIGLYR